MIGDLGFEVEQTERTNEVVAAYTSQANALIEDEDEASLLTEVLRAAYLEGYRDALIEWRKV